MQRLHLKFQKRNFILVFDVRPSFRAKGGAVATRLDVRRARSPQMVAPRDKQTSQLSMSTHAWASDTHEIARVSAEGCSADAVGKQNSHFATRPTRDQPAVGESSAQEFNSLMVVHSCL